MYAASSLPLVNSTNVGGSVEAWVANRIFGCLPLAHRVRVLGDQPAEEGVQLPGRDPRLPALEGGVERRHQPVDVPAGPGGDVDPRRPLHPDELALDLALQVVAALLVDQVPLVEGDHQRAAGLGDRVMIRVSCSESGCEASTIITQTSARSMAALVRREA